MVSLVGCVFIDGTDLFFTVDSEKELIQTAQDGLNLWESSLRATGGFINAVKKLVWNSVEITIFKKEI